MAIFVAGTGTDVGKTLFSALLMGRYAKSLGLKYHKAIQTGEISDRATVQRLTGLDDTFFLDEIYSFSLAASPHFAAESAGLTVDVTHLKDRLPKRDARCVIELAGGLEVPLRRYYTNLDLLHEIRLPVILVASTGLGTINHTVLSLKAMRQAQVQCAGVFFIGRDDVLAEDNIRTVMEMTGVNILGHFFLRHGEYSPNLFQSLIPAFDVDGKILKVFQ